MAKKPKPFRIDPSWSADRIASEREQYEYERSKPARHAQTEANKAAIREHHAGLQDKYAGWESKNKEKAAQTDFLAKEKRAGNLSDVEKFGVDHAPTEKGSVELPDAVGSKTLSKKELKRAKKYDAHGNKIPKAERKRIAKRERKIAKQKQARARMIDKHLKSLPRDLAQTAPETLSNLAPDPGKPETFDLSDRPDVGPAPGPDPNDPVLKSAEALGDIGALREAIDGEPTGLDWDKSVPQEVRDAKEQEYIDRGLAKPGERILDEPLPISTAEMRRNAIARNRIFNTLSDQLKESIPPKVEDEEEFDALLVSHDEAVEAFENLQSRFTSANLSKLQSGKISRSLVAQDMEKIIASGVKDNLQRAKLLGYVTELRSIE